nr:immunoglobulin heavy chain junction region [Macaca mulatta]
CAIWQSGFDYW